MKRGLIMSKGGGGGGPQTTQSTVTQTNLPEYAEPYFTRLMQRSEAESLQPYRTYTGQRLAPLSPTAQRVLGRQTALGLSTGPQETRDASIIARDVGGLYQQGMPSTTTVPTFLDTVGTGDEAQGIASMYMDPFQQLVTDIEKREAQRASDITGQQIESQATQAGGLGGYREAILQAERQRNLAQQKGDIQARGLRDSFAQAQQQFERDRAARLRQQQADAQRRLASAELLAKQGPMQQQLAFDRLRAAQEAQETARNFRQAGLDIGYQDFLNQVAFPRQQLGFYSQILQGLPVTPGTQVSQYQPRPSTTQQLLGLGLGGLGLYQALGGGRR